ncbi:hypothetical protein V7174_09410 [Bacillus subtilis]|uniref:hypothetical protein n=1 Tax=Bacillus subtilis TaxID=1423 RepID=UPI002DBF3948|nr:hypothetical protein [Bacillus subtilis]MEC2198632.1 hypothetical protein [Bacillus subtilis]
MKKLIVLTLICLGFMSSYSISNAEAKLTLEYKNVNFHMSEDSESFSMADYFDRNYDRTWLFYKFTIRNAEGCTLNMKISRITLAGWVFPRSVKEFTGNYLDYTATDRVEGDANRNHVLEITKNPSCGDVWINGIYGFEHEEPDEY